MNAAAQPDLFAGRRLGDAWEVFRRIQWTYPSARLDWQGLLTCWRPPGPRGRRWSDARLYAAVEALIAAGHVEYVGQQLGTTAAGRAFYAVVDSRATLAREEG